MITQPRVLPQRGINPTPAIPQASLPTTAVAVIVVALPSLLLLLLLLLLLPLVLLLFLVEYKVTPMVLLQQHAMGQRVVGRPRGLGAALLKQRVRHARLLTQ